MSNEDVNRKLTEFLSSPEGRAQVADFASQYIHERRLLLRLQGSRALPDPGTKKGDSSVPKG